MSPSPASKAFGRAHVCAGGSLPSARRLRPCSSNSAWLPWVLRAAGARRCTCSILPRTPKVPWLGELRRAEGAGVAAIAAADADILVVQHHTLVGAVEAVAPGQTAMEGASLQCMQATEIDFSPGTPSLRVTTPAWRFTPQGHLMLVLASCDAAVAFDAALGITDQNFHSCHCGVLMHFSRCRSWSWFLASWSRCRNHRWSPCSRPRHAPQALAPLG